MPAPPPPRIGWPLLPLPDSAGRLHWPDLSESIEQQIRVLLQTRPGEQLMRPGFGIGLQEFIGRPDGTALRRAIQEQIESGLARWETRILLEGIDVYDDPGGVGRLRVEIRYRIRRTHAPRSLGITLALENG